jgi:hypothetical protein
MFAAAMVQRHQKHRLDAGVERMFFGWILEVTRTLATPELMAKTEEMRQRVLERTEL